MKTFLFIARSRSHELFDVVVYESFKINRFSECVMKMIIFSVPLASLCCIVTNHQYGIIFENEIPIFSFINKHPDTMLHSVRAHTFSCTHRLFVYSYYVNLCDRFDQWNLINESNRFNVMKSLKRFPSPMGFGQYSSTYMTDLIVLMLNWN